MNSGIARADLVGLLRVHGKAVPDDPKCGLQLLGISPGDALSRPCQKIAYSRSTPREYLRLSPQASYSGFPLCSPPLFHLPRLPRVTLLIKPGLLIWFDLIYCIGRET